MYLPHAQTWVLEQASDPIGFIAMIDDEIGGLFLDSVFHGKGYGKALVDYLVASKGALRVEVFEDNTIGRKFYKRYGFIETERYEHESSGQMTLKLVMSDHS